MSDRCVQKEEIEALEAIYGDAVAQVSHSDAEAVTITLSDGDVRLGELKVMFPGDYPSSMCPVFEIRSELCSGPDEMREVSEQLTALFVPGEVVVYQCVEWLKDHLLEKSAKSSKEEGPCCCVDKVSRSASRFEEDKDEPSSPDSSSHLQSSILTGEKMVEEVAISDISHGEPLTDRKSTFQAHVAEVHSREEVLLILKKLKENRKITVATHNILAYRIYDSQKHVYIHDCDDDGESAAGSRLLHLLELMDVCNAVVVVTRWYGGIHLGPDRFKHINSCARSVVQETGIGLQHKISKQMKELERPNSSSKSRKRKK